MKKMMLLATVVGIVALMMAAAPAFAADNNKHNDTKLDRQDVRLDQNLLNQNNDVDFNRFNDFNRFDGFNRFDNDDLFFRNDCGFSCNNDVDLVQFPSCFPFNNCNDGCFNHCNDDCFRDGCNADGTHGAVSGSTVIINRG